MEEIMKIEKRFFVACSRGQAVVALMLSLAAVAVPRGC